MEGFKKWWINEWTGTETNVSLWKVVTRTVLNEWIQSKLKVLKQTNKQRDPFECGWISQCSSEWTILATFLSHSLKFSFQEPQRRKIPGHLDDLEGSSGHCGPPWHILIVTYQPSICTPTHVGGLKESGKYLWRLSVPSAVWPLSHEAGVGEKICFSAEITM